MRERLRIAHFLPELGERAFSPANYVVSQLGGALESQSEVVYFGDPLGFQELPSRLPLHRAFAEHREKPFDICLYHFEDSKHARLSRLHQGFLPGVVWFHDYLHKSHAPESLCDSPWEEVVPTLNLHEPGRPLNVPPRSKAVDRDVPQPLRESSLAVGAFFSNPQGHAEFRRSCEHFPTLCSQSWYLPLPVAKGAASAAIAANRCQIAFCGGTELQFRTEKLLQAINRLPGRVDLVWLVDAGEEVAAREIANRYHRIKIELIIGRTPERWNQIVQQSGIALHPFFSVFGSVEPYLGISLMAGLATVATDFGVTDYLPSGVVFKVQPGTHESFAYERILSTLLADRELRLEVGRRSREFALELYDRDLILKELLSALHRLAPENRRVLAQWGQLIDAGQRELFGEIERFMKLDSPCESLLLKSVVEPAFQELGWLTPLSH